jgi:hypothetical protein
MNTQTCDVILVFSVPSKTSLLLLATLVLEQTPHISALASLGFVASTAWNGNLRKSRVTGDIEDNIIDGGEDKAQQLHRRPEFI